MGKYGELLVSTLLLSGASTSGHPAIVSMKTPKKTTLIGDMVIYSISRRSAVNTLAERAIRVFHDSGILNSEPDLESVAMALDFEITLHRLGKVKEASEINRSVVRKVEALRRQNTIEELGGWESKKARLLRHITFSTIIEDCFLSAYWRQPSKMSDQETIELMSYLHPSLPTQLVTYIVPTTPTPAPPSLPNFSHPDPDFSSPLWEEMVVIGAAAFIRSLHALRFRAYNCTDINAAAGYFKTAMAWVMWRRKWVEQLMGSGLEFKDNCLGALKRSIWIFNERTEFPTFVFTNYAALSYYLKRLNEPIAIDSELRSVVELYENVVERTIEYIAEQLKKNVIAGNIIAGSQAARDHKGLCHTIMHVLRHTDFMKRYASEAGTRGVNRKEVVFWIAEGFKLAAYYDQFYSVMSIELMSYLDSEPEAFVETLDSLTTDFL
ncbi:hypothetical protein BT69DRAFT_1278350 [Atractiella rhizophila]|nr:hypothetical protein BT69DRAFT_1278350 [Atractiella rhizophila]